MRRPVRQSALTDPLIDDLEAMIDDTHVDPAQAAMMKARVRARLARVPDSAPEPDGEEFWDNVPL